MPGGHEAIPERALPMDGFLKNLCWSILLSFIHVCELTAVMTRLNY